MGAFAEYFVKVELTLYGFQVYTTEVDDRGIDFVTRYGDGPFIQIQVKSLRSPGYAFMQKVKFVPSESLYLALGLLFESKAPVLYLIPSTMWSSPGGIFADRNYEGRASDPEWGLNISMRNMASLVPYLFETTVESLINRSGSKVSPVTE